MVFVVIITFALSWLPLYSIFCYVKLLSQTTMDASVYSVVRIILPVAQWLGASNSCINPVLYAFMNRTYRIEFQVGIIKLSSLKKNDFLPFFPTFRIFSATVVHQKKTHFVIKQIWSTVVSDIVVSKILIHPGMHRKNLKMLYLPMILQ
jgi:neuropeptide FF receptor 2